MGDPAGAQPNDPLLANDPWQQGRPGKSSRTALGKGQTAPPSDGRTDALEAFQLQELLRITAPNN
eukprot:7904261-Karenia_brevis.AAC.1